jgi:hypothetical protein
LALTGGQHVAQWADVGALVRTDLIIEVVALREAVHLPKREVDHHHNHRNYQQMKGHPFGSQKKLVHASPKVSACWQN